ncbi:hypothetical protein [Vannielia litorea]|uniref:Cytochrome C oxidase assembly protein n=1 Tax=Vannielia litorea TaxID=1217970 RepID=A0A1N6EB98_9RHOB|nr:hypothetical protein [Vannielia litorea]SIN80299.1 hypothetical protein SAMN05444002_0546 [Vannielia litorea]
MIRAEHELHQRRLGRNVGVAVSLVALVVIVLGLTFVKVTRGGAAAMEGFDHAVRPAMTTSEGGN